MARAQLGRHLAPRVVVRIAGLRDRLGPPQLPARIRVVAGDTDLTPVDLGSYSSRVTFMAGNAALDAARKMKEQIFEAVAEKMHVPADRLEASWRQIYDREDRTNCVTFEDACIIAESALGTLGHGPRDSAPARPGGTHDQEYQTQEQTDGTPAPPGWQGRLQPLQGGVLPQERQGLPAAPARAQHQQPQRGERRQQSQQCGMGEPGW